MSSVLDRYKSTQVRHPSWRVYRTVSEIQKDTNLSEDCRSITVEDLGLKSNIDVYYPYTTNDDLIIELGYALTKPDYKDEYFRITDCLALFVDVKARQQLEARLMSGEMPEDAATDLGYDIPMVQTYAQIFFDVSVWRTSADKLSYVRKGTSGEDSRLKNLALEKGVEYLDVHEFNMPAKVKMEKVLSQLFGLAYERVMVMMKSDDLEEQRCAQDWLKYNISIFRELKNASKADGGIRELTIALKSDTAPTRSIDDLTNENNS